MKFGALLRSSAREVPELQSLFVCYKQLKKRLKRLPVREELSDAVAEASRDVQENERAFVALLISDIQAFNETFVEREEQSVIQLSLLEERASAAYSAEEVATVYKSFVNFHGQTLMLVHWSILAYTSVLKILKKHHKRTGLQVQQFNMQQLLSQPFCSVELISGLVRKAEDKAQELAGLLNPGTAQGSLSAASPASSPVAELISAARQSVQEIAQTAAQGTEALDEHLRDQPTSSDEASAAGGEAEVVSGRMQDCTSVAEQPAGEGVSGTLEGVATESQPKRHQENCSCGQPAYKQQKVVEGSKGCSQRTGRQLYRTTSVAGDSEAPNTPISAQNGNVGEARDREAVPGAATPDHHESSKPANSAAHAADANSDGRAASEQLTMGQGYRPSGSRNILRQTQMALGLWEQLHYTASTPSTVVPPLKDAKDARGSANSAA